MVNHGMIEQLLTCWGMASTMPGREEVNTTSSSNGGRGGTATSGSISDGLTSWVMAPNIRDSLPCMADLLHAYLQRPGRAAGSVKEGLWLCLWAEQLQAWVAMAASAKAPGGAIPAEHIVWVSFTAAAMLQAAMCWRWLAS
jgi:hypothetical protein